MSNETHLKLYEKDLIPSFRGKAIPQLPKFFNFEGVTPKQFNEADLITFEHPDGRSIVMKDRYGVRQPAMKLVKDGDK